MLGSQFLLPQRANIGKRAVSQLQNCMRHHYHLHHIVDVDRARAGVEGAVLREGGSDGGRCHEKEGEALHLFIKQGVTRDLKSLILWFNTRSRLYFPTQE